MNKNIVVASAVTMLFAGCASERVVLLPSADGQPSAVVVRDRSGEVVLDAPYAAMRRDLGNKNPYLSSREDVQQRFGAALGAQPPRPQSYVLYFEAGGSQLTGESQAMLAGIRQEIARRPASEVMVIGHTDRVGSAEANDLLSLTRAEGIRAMLVADGVAVEKLEAVGRGERDPLVPTADEVDEPKNRRVEINVR